MTGARVPLKYLASVNDDKLPDCTDPDYEIRYVDIGCVGRGRLVEPPRTLRFADAPSRARRLVKPGDTIISTVRTYLRAVWAVEEPTDDLVVSTGFAVIRPSGIDPGFLRWVIESDTFVEDVVARSTGVSYPAITPSELASIKIAVPSPSQQRRIAWFLDAEAARINALIEAKQQMITVASHKAATCIDLVFHGDRVRTAPDGVPVGLGTWPMAWLGAVALVQSGLTIHGARRFDGETVDLPYLRVANVQDGQIVTRTMKVVPVDEAMIQRHRLLSGDVLMTEGGDPDKLGRGAVWKGEIDPCLHQNHVFAIRTDPSRLLPEFLALLTRTTYARAYFEMTAVKTTGVASTSATKIAAFRVPVPPIEEQGAVVDRIQRALQPLAVLTTTLSRQIELLKERRQALITAAVTGEIEV